MSFTFYSGNTALDFAGTLQTRRGSQVDVISTPGELSGWSVAAGLLDAPPQADADDLRHAVELREAIYRLAWAAYAGSTCEPADRDLLNRVAAGVPVSVRLNDDGTVERSGDLAAALTTVARLAVELFGGAAAALIKECGAERCTRL